MSAPRRIIFRNVYTLTAIVGLMASVTACKTTDIEFLTGGPPIVLPTYSVGDTYNYINDRKQPVLRQVVRVEGETVEWKTETPYRYLGFRSFFMPRISWSGTSSSGVATALPNPNLMWPLKRGNKAEIAITYKRTDRNKAVSRKYKQTWQCKTYKRQQITVPAGTFDTIKVICRALTKTGQRSKRRRIWYFAPKIGHFVKRVRKYSHSPDKTWELVSFRKAPRR